LPGKNAPSALCRALDQNAHGKGCAVRILVFAVRRARESGSVSRVKRELFLLFYCFFFPIINFPISTGTLFNLFGRQDYSNLLFFVYWCMCGCITMHRTIQHGAVPVVLYMSSGFNFYP
jgi:hypothetical protein